MLYRIESIVLPVVEEREVEVVYVIQSALLRGESHLNKMLHVNRRCAASRINLNGSFLILAFGAREAQSEQRWLVHFSCLHYLLCRKYHVDLCLALVLAPLEQRHFTSHTSKKSSTLIFASGKRCLLLLSPLSPFVQRRYSGTVESSLST
jgi:hypothetical protein